MPLDCFYYEFVIRLLDQAQPRVYAHNDRSDDLVVALDLVGRLNATAVVVPGNAVLAFSRLYQTC